MRQAAKPNGPEEVTAALTAAAATLFAEHGPGGASVRDIAEAAGVNHGLVHHYFGSKEALLRAALRSRAAASVDHFTGVGIGPELLVVLRQAASDPSAGWRLLARCLLDGYGDELRGGDYEGIAQFIDRWSVAQRAGQTRADVDASHAVELALAAMLGWLLFGPYISAATGLADTGGDGLDELIDTLARLLAPLPQRPDS